MTLPKDQQLSTEPVRAAFIGGRSGGVTALKDYEEGPIALQNPSRGLMYQTWRTRVVQGEVLLSGRYTPEIKLTDLGSDVEEISFSFDRSGRHIMVYVQAGVTKMHWYNTQTAEYEIRTFGSEFKTPKLFHDDKRDVAATTSDVLFFYIRSGKLYYRQQRDRYDNEYLLATVPPGRGIKKVGMLSNWRIGIMLDDGSLL